MIHNESLSAALNLPGVRSTLAGPSAATGRIGAALRSPGRLPRHYSPRATLKVLSWRDDKDLRSQISRFDHPTSKVHIVAHTVIPAHEPWARVSVIPHDAEAFARAIYAELHACDDLGAELIIVEAPPQTDEWQGIRDRLNRAAAV